MPFPSDKPTLRKLIREKRRQLSPATQLRHSYSVCRSILSTSQLLNGRKNIAIYNAFDGELATNLLGKHLAKRGFKIYVPRVSQDQMSFVRQQPQSTQSQSLSGLNFEEPQGFCRPIKPQQLDIIFMPLVAADKTGQRLGMGGGFYDRALAFKASSRHKNPLLIGVAHELQITKKLANETWDIKLNGLVTERGFFSLR